MAEPFLKILRDSTKWFINSDPTDVVFTPYADGELAAGGTAKVAGTPRASQTVKLISTSESGLSAGEGGSDRAFEYTIVLEHDAEIAIGDRWGNFYVYAIEPRNGYEVKARAKQYSKAPTDG